MFLKHIQTLLRMKELVRLSIGTSFRIKADELSHSKSVLKVFACPDYSLPNMPSSMIVVLPHVRKVGKSNVVGIWMQMKDGSVWLMSRIEVQ